MKRFDVKTRMIGVAIMACLVSSAAHAQTGNPWHPNAKAASSQTQPAQTIAPSRYAPADLEQRLSAIKPTRPATPQGMVPRNAPLQPPVAMPPNAYRYGTPQQGFNGYPPNYRPRASYGSGGYRQNNNGFAPNFGGFPGGGSAPFNFSPFGFF